MKLDFSKVEFFLYKKCLLNFFVCDIMNLLNKLNKINLGVFSILKGKLYSFSSSAISGIVFVKMHTPPFIVI